MGKAIALLALLAASLARGQVAPMDPYARVGYVAREARPPMLNWSHVALIATTGLDVASSRGLYERNPILGRGLFGARQTAMAFSITGGLVVAEVLIVRRWPGTGKVFRWVNFGAAGMHGAAAAHNWRIER